MRVVYLSCYFAVFLLESPSTSVNGFCLLSSSSRRPASASNHHHSMRRVFSISSSVPSPSLSSVTLRATAEDEGENSNNEFKEQTKRLCDERNIPFEKIKNARDLCTVHNSPILPNRVIRTGKVTDATRKDVQLLFHEMKVKTLVDLRSPTELKDEKNGVHVEEDELEECTTCLDVFEGFTDVVWSKRKVVELHEGYRFRKRDMVRTLLRRQSQATLDVHELATPLAPREERAQRKERHFVSLMDELKYIRATLAKLEKKDIAKALLKSPGAIVSKNVRSSVKDVFLKEINQGGLPMLNELILNMAGPGIKYTLDLISDETRHPIAFYCTAGKDRTGVISAIVLATVGVSDKDIVEDYSLSANVYAEINDHKAMVGALSQRNLDPNKFLVAPPEVMQETLDTIRKNYGTVEDYLDSIGFHQEDRDRLRQALTIES